MSVAFHVADLARGGRRPASTSSSSPTRCRRAAWVAAACWRWPRRPWRRAARSSSASSTSRCAERAGWRRSTSSRLDELERHLDGFRIHRSATRMARPARVRGARPARRQRRRQPPDRPAHPVAGARRDIKVCRPRHPSDQRGGIVLVEPKPAQPSSTRPWRWLPQRSTTAGPIDPRIAADKPPTEYPRRPLAANECGR